MNFKFKKGYTLYEKGNKDLCFVVPHSGAALGNTISRDDNADTVASLSWKILGGRLIISNMPRNREWGIDFNRDIPKIRDALNMFDSFFEQGYNEKVYQYTKKYAWVAKDEEDYYNRLNIYQNFWDDVSKSKNIILIHRMFSRFKAVPSIIDLITFENKGIKKDIINQIANEINEKHYMFLEGIKEDYGRAIIFESKRNLLNLLRLFSTIKPSSLKGFYKDTFEKDLEKIFKYADKIAVSRLKKNFTPQNYLEAVENAVLHIPPPRVTVEEIMDGSLSLGPVNKLFPYNDKLILEIEGVAFINFWYPDMTSQIINEIVERII